jgi:hypothetical protein
VVRDCAGGHTLGPENAGIRGSPKFAFPRLHMTAKQADALHAYVIDGAWKAYNKEHGDAGAGRN